MKFEIKIEVIEPLHIYKETWCNYGYVELTPGIYTTQEGVAPDFLSLGNGIVLYISRTGYHVVADVWKNSVFLPVKATIDIVHSDVDGTIHKTKLK